MATTSTLRPILDRKQWEPCSFAPTNSAAGSFIVSGALDMQYQYFVASATVVYEYDPEEDGWMQLPSPALAGTFGAGSCGASTPQGPSGTATAGTTTTLTTNLTAARDFRGFKILITGGPGAGSERTIASNTIGANSVITVTSPFSAAITAASTYIIYTGRLYLLNAGTVAAGSFKYWERFTNTWVNAAQTGLPATIGTDARLLSTAFTTPAVTGTSTGSNTTTTLNNTGKAWPTHNWANFQVRITAGTGAGQIRTIASNTATALTVSAAWTTTPDATSQYAIEGNQDYLYFLGNNAVTMYRYNISAATWTTLAPTVARAGAPVAGFGANIPNAVTAFDWVAENTDLTNGRYIYSFRGAGTVLDRYDISLNTWAVVSYSPAAETLHTTNSYNYNGNYVYIMLGNTGRMIKFNLTNNQMEPCSQLWYTQGTAVLGDRLVDVTYTDGATKLTYLYYLCATSNMWFRLMLI